MPGLADHQISRLEGGTRLGLEGGQQGRQALPVTIAIRAGKSVEAEASTFPGSEYRCGITEKVRGYANRKVQIKHQTKTNLHRSFSADRIHCPDTHHPG
jgi:hypothetical protein